MKIAIICDDFPSEGRPTFVFVEQLVIELSRQGVDISVIAPQSLTRHLIRHVPLLPKVSVINSENYTYRVYRPYSISLGNVPGWVNGILSVLNYKRMENCLNKEKVGLDAIYGHFWHSAYSVRKFAYKHNLPLFVACGEGDNAIEYLVNRISHSEKEKFSKYVKGVISVSSENKRRSIQNGLAQENDIIVLPNSVDTSIFVKDNNIDIRKELGVKPDDFLIAFTGAFIHRKGSARLSAAIDKLNNPRVKSLFIGAPLDGDDATPTCNGIVHMGKIEHSLLPQYLYAADVFCLPTLNEGCSNAIVEALACGLPVISSNLPFNEDILDESNSILVDPLSADEISSALRTLIDSKEYRKKLSEGANAKARYLTINQRAGKIIDFIKSRL